MNNLLAHLKSNAHKMLNVSDAILDQLMPEPGLPKPSRAVARRQLANIMRMPRFCARSTCRRSGACRGEPLECLQYALPLLPPEAFADLLNAAKRKRIRHDDPEPGRQRAC